MQKNRETKCEGGKERRNEMKRGIEHYMTERQAKQHMALCPAPVHMK